MINEKDLLTDALQTQKFLTGNYNIWAGECVNEGLRNTMMDILKDEHCIQNDVFTIMSDKGFYKTTPADATKIQDAATTLTQQS